MHPCKSEIDCKSTMRLCAVVRKTGFLYHLSCSVFSAQSHDAHLDRGRNMEKMTGTSIRMFDALCTTSLDMVGLVSRTRLTAS